MPHPVFRPPWPARRLCGARARTGIPAALLLLLLYGVSFGSDGAVLTFTLVNRTSYHLHAVNNNQPHAYLPPGSSIQAELPAYSSVAANARYSPGQGVRGEAARYFESDCTTTSSGTSSVSQDCSSNSSDGSESGSTSSHSSSTSCRPIRWQVTAAELDSSAEGDAR